MFYKKKIPFPFIDIYLFHWYKPFVHTALHDHAKNGCYIWLCKGCLKENIYNHSKKFLRSNVYNAPSLSYIHNSIGLHTIKPLEHSYSIHFYYPKGHKTKYFTNS